DVVAVATRDARRIELLSYDVDHGFSRLATITQDEVPGARDGFARQIAMSAGGNVIAAMSGSGSFDDGALPLVAVITRNADGTRTLALLGRGSETGSEDAITVSHDGSRIAWVNGAFDGPAALNVSTRRASGQYDEW